MMDMSIFGTLSPNFEEHFYTFVAVIAALGFASAIGFGIACRSIVRSKGYPDEMNHGFLWGFFLGLIGLVVCAVKQPFFNGQPPFYNGPYYGQPPYGQNYYGQNYYGQPYNNGQPYGGQPYYGQPQQMRAPGEWTCSCGAANTPDSNFCRICGMKKQG